MTETLLPAPRSSADVEPRLIELAHERMIEPADRAGHHLDLVGATVLPQGQVICRSKHGAWLFVDHRNDPTARKYNGKIPIPGAELERLKMLDKAGVRPDHVWLAHELPPEWKEGDGFQRLVPAPAEIREHDERLLRRVRAVVTLGRRTASAIGTALTVPFLDPIVLGGVQHPELPIVEWAVLARWDWH